MFCISSACTESSTISCAKFLLDFPKFSSLPDKLCRKYFSLKTCYTTILIYNPFTFPYGHNNLYIKHQCHSIHKSNIPNNFFIYMLLSSLLYVPNIHTYICFYFLFFIINLYEKSKGKMMPQQAGGSQPSRNPRKPRNTGQSPTSQPSPVQPGLSQPPSYQYQPSPQQPWTPPPPPYQQAVHGQPTMPFYPQAGQQPPSGINPPQKKKRSSGCAIGLGIIIALFLCVGFNALTHSQNDQRTQAGATNDGSQTVVVATMPSHTTQQIATSVPTKPIASPLPTIVPTQLPPTLTQVPVQPTQPPVQPTQPPAQPTQPPAQPTAPPVQGVGGNPWGYNFDATGGSFISNPNPAFCDAGYFSCVTTFWKSTNGYVVQCANGLYSHSGGVRGACSRDGGEANILYMH